MTDNPKLLSLLGMCRKAKKLSCGHDAAIGDGVINFESVLRSAESVGCSYYVIEQKTDTPYRDIEKSFTRLESIRSKIEDKE